VVFLTCWERIASHRLLASSADGSIAARAYLLRTQQSTQSRRFKLVPRFRLDGQPVSSRCTVERRNGLV